MIMNRHKYQDKRLALQSLTSMHPKSSFNYEVRLIRLIIIKQILEYLGDAVAEWLVMDLIVAMDRNHKISRNTQICNCKKGVIPICPFTVSSKELYYLYNQQL